MPTHALDALELAVEEKFSCPFCHQDHINPPVNDQEMRPSIDSDEVSIGIANSAPGLVAIWFPCLAPEIRDIQSDFLPEKTQTEASAPRNRNYIYPLNKDHILRLCYLATIRPDNNKVPITQTHANLFEGKINWQKYTQYWVSYRPAIFYAIFAIGSAGTEYLNYINIYSTIYPADNSTPTVEVNDIATNAVQDTLTIAIGGLCTFFGNLTTLIWAGTIPNIAQKKAEKSHLITHELHEDYLDLCRTLLLLNFYFPDLALKLINEIPVNIIVDRVRNSAPSELVAQIIGADNLLGVVDYIKSNGERWPTNSYLQQYIVSLENGTIER